MSTTANDSVLLETASHPVQRITAATGGSLDEFVAQFEAAAPPLDLSRNAVIAGSATGSGPTAAEIAAATPNSFRVFASDDTSRTPSDGGQTRVVSWLMGNRGIAEHVVHHDPRALLYAPLRIVVFEERAGHASVTFERPSDVFSSLASPAITDVGQRLDGKLADLLDALGVPEAAEALRNTPDRRGGKPNGADERSGPTTGRA